MATVSNASPDGPPPRSVDVLIAGAGPAGAASAIHFAAAGWRVLVADRARFPRDKACSEYMSPAGTRLLHRLGVLEDLERAGAAPLAGTTVVAAHGARLQGRFARSSVTPWRPTGLAVRRTLLDTRLVAAAREAGALVREGTAVQGLTRLGGRVTGATLRDERGTLHPVQATLTIGADGLHSQVARVLGRRRRGVPRRMAFVAHVHEVEGLGDCAELHVGGEGYAGINPLGGGLANVAVVVPAALAQSARGRATEFLLERLERLPGTRGRVRRARLAGPVLATGPFSAWSSRVVGDGALLAGDAAEFFDPFTGEGIYTALRGAELAATVALPLLARGGPIRAGDLAPYRHARRRAFLGKWMVERLIGYAMLWPGLFNRGVERIGRRRGMADTLIGVTGDFIPARAVLNPAFLARAVL